jgi:glycosyltransferase involved in cell wall biosynthesis
MIRVLHLIDRLGLGGGTERQLLLNVRNLDQTRIDSVVCQVHPFGGGQADLEAAHLCRDAGARVVTLGLRGGRGWGVSLAALRRLIRSECIDLVHTNLFHADLLGGLAGRSTSRLVLQSLVNVQGSPRWSEVNAGAARWKHRVVLAVYALLARHCASHLVAVSEEARRVAVLALRVPGHKVSVVRRAVPPAAPAERGGDAARERLREELGLAGCWPVLLNVARVVPNKGQVHLVEAVARLRAEFPGVRLLVAGEDAGQLDLREVAARRGVGDLVSLLGFRSDVGELHRISDIGVFPSVHEGFGNALAEACAAGLPCVATDIGGFTEIVRDGETAVVVPPQSATALAGGIAALARDPPGAAAMGLRAAEHVRRNFSVARAVSALTAVYESVARAHGAHGTGGAP